MRKFGTPNFTPSSAVTSCTVGVKAVSSTGKRSTSSHRNLQSRRHSNQSQIVSIRKQRSVTERRLGFTSESRFTAIALEPEPAQLGRSERHRDSSSLRLAYTRKTLPIAASCPQLQTSRMDSQWRARSHGAKQMSDLSANDRV